MSCSYMRSLNMRGGWLSELSVLARERMNALVECILPQSRDAQPCQSHLRECLATVQSVTMVEVSANLEPRNGNWDQLLVTVAACPSLVFPFHIGERRAIIATSAALEAACQVLHVSRC